MDSLQSPDKKLRREDGAQVFVDILFDYLRTIEHPLPTLFLFTFIGGGGGGGGQDWQEDW